MANILESIRYIQKKYDSTDDEDVLALRDRNYQDFQNDPLGQKWKQEQINKNKVRNEFAERIGFVEDKVQ